MLAPRQTATVAARLDGEPVRVELAVATDTGAYVVVLASTVPGPAAIELHSTYCGHPDADTVAVHMSLAAGRPAQITTRTRAAGLVCPWTDPRRCLVDHAHELVEHAASVGAHLAIDLRDEHLALLAA